MNKGKVMGFIAVGLLIIAGIYATIKIINNNKTFEKMIITYKDNRQQYTDLKVDNVIVINNISFWIVSTTEDAIVLNTSEYLKQDGEEKNEFQITLEKETIACFNDSDCVYFSLE